MPFGFCRECQYWNRELEGELKPCIRINEEMPDVEMDGAVVPAEQQSFSTRENFGCSLFEPDSEVGPVGEGVEEENIIDRPAPGSGLDAYL